MFVLVEISDVLRIIPEHFNNESSERLEIEINRKYSNKVIHKLGLCILLHDLLEVGDPLIYPGDGSAHIKTKFRMVVFRPFIGEVLYGKIKSCSEKGIFVTMGFFDDIFIPRDNFQPNTTFDKSEQLWVWTYGEDKFYLDLDESIVFRVQNPKFYEARPADAGVAAMSNTVAIASPPMVSEDSAFSNHESPFSLEGTINDSGLGLPAWW